MYSRTGPESKPVLSRCVGMIRCDAGEVAGVYTELTVLRQRHCARVSERRGRGGLDERGEGIYKMDWTVGRSGRWIEVGGRMY